MSETATQKVTIYIDGKPYQAEAGEPVLQVAIRNGIDIPHLCYHEDLPIEANCRLCLVNHLFEKNGEAKEEVTTSCTLKASDGLRVNLNTAKVQELRQENLALLLAEHKDLCPKCQQGLPCQTADLMEKYGVTGQEYLRKHFDFPMHLMGTAAEFDPNLCIKCGRCVNTCAAIGVNFLELEGKGAETHLVHSENPKIDCIYCGQCTTVCPVNAIREQSHLDQVEAALASPDKIVIVQMAPSIRASIGEEFGMPAGTNTESKMFTALRKLGFDKIFDVNMGADITTMVESQELIDRVKEEQRTGERILPMFTSCCPGWVKFLEFYYPEMISHLTNSRSPQIHSGGAYKTWWAEKEGVDPEKIVVVSLMPCTSKKYEASMEKLMININGKKVKPVDYVLTTRETAVLLKKHGIDLKDLKDGKADQYGEYSGAAAIYGASGGVMESALRSAARILTGKDLEKIDFEEVRGMKGIKKAIVRLETSSGEKIRLNVAVVATARHARQILEEIKRTPKAYDYIEFMACPGGCIGGGGQPLGTTKAIVKKRIEGLYSIDRSSAYRQAHKNPVVQDFFNWLSKNPEKTKALLYTSYSKKEKFE